MPKLTPEQFAQIVKVAAERRGTVKNIRVGGYSVIVDIISRSGKSAYQWSFKFDEVTGNYEYRGPFPAAKEPQFFGDAIRKAIKGITGS